MSSALAVAGVTAVLRDLLNGGMLHHNVSGVLGSAVTVSLLPPDRVVANGGAETSQLNLFLHQVTPNSGWRNEGLPARDGAGRQRLSNPPLALNLHYLLSAYSAGELHAEILLGYAMQLLHETPVLTRDAIRTALTPSPAAGAALPPALRALTAAGLERQIELIKITPEYLNTEEMSKLWSATLSNFRPTAAYTASVVLIEAAEPLHAPLPVLSRGPVDPLSRRDRGAAVAASLLPPVPTLEAVIPAGGQPVARLGETVDLIGHHLDGSERSALLVNDRFEIEQPLPALVTGSATLLRFMIPLGLGGDLPVGVYRVGARLLRRGDAAPRQSNRLALTLAPALLGLPLSVARGAAGEARLTLNFRPPLRAGQEALLVLGQQQYRPQPFAPPTARLDFVIDAAAPGSHLARLRVDGIDSPIADRSSEPPRFFDQRITIT